MSTKTITKRVALATVVALGAGVLSLVSVSSASATDNSLAGNAGPSAAAGVLNIGSLNSPTGSAVTSATDGTAYRSVGIVNVGDIAGNTSPVAGTTQTAILLSSGKLAVYAGAKDAYNGGTISVIGGTLTAVNSSGVSNDGTIAAYAHQSASNVFGAVVTPSAGATSMTVRYYKLTSGANSTEVDGSLTSSTLGTLAGQITVSIASSSSAGTVSVAKSGIYYSSAASGDRGRSSDATSGTWKNGSPTSQFANISVKDAYGTAIASTTGLLTATATNGAYVHLDASSGVASTQSSAFYTGASPDNTMLTVSAPTFAPLNTTVTISYNGTVIGTKNFTFTGPITKVTVGTPALIKSLNDAAGTKKVATIAFADAAGNNIYKDDTYYPANGFVTDSASDVTGSLAVAPVSGTTGYVDWTSGATAGSKTLIVDYVNTNGVIAVANATTVTAADVANTYTVAYDKSTYHPGDIATLTITFKDSKGNLAYDYTTDPATGPLAGANADMIAAGGGTISAAPSAANTSLGIKTYKILVGITDGAYNTVVNIKNPTVAFASSQSAQIASFAVASGSTSLNDVLKGIVSLIASINKQIAALAKLVTKK
jgi:hypothetical protein